MAIITYILDGEEIEEKIDLWDNQKRLEEIKKIGENVRIPESEIYDNEDSK